MEMPGIRLAQACCEHVFDKPHCGSSRFMHHGDVTAMLLDSHPRHHSGDDAATRRLKYGAKIEDRQKER